MKADLLEDVDLSDLDLLDDTHRHACCELCHSPVGPGDTFLALCGRRAFSRVGPSIETPPNACPDCRALFNRSCEAHA